MAKNIPMAIFRDKKGIEYVLKYGPKGNLRPYTIRPVKTITKVISKIPKKPYVVIVLIIAVAVISISLLIRNKSRNDGEEKNSN